MELPDTTGVRAKSQEPEQEQGLPNGSASLFVRLWTYAGPGQNLSSLALDKDREVAELIRKLITEGQGEITEQNAEGLAARFKNALYALSAAKTLQQRLLTFHREQPPQQVVSCILVSGQEIRAARADESSTQIVTAAQVMLDCNYSAQILVSEAIYELAKNEPGFQFNPKPVREAGTGAPEAIYELLWTDESTYGHLRETGQSTGSTGIHTAGRYKILAELGHGAMGIVYKAYDQLIGRTVALKTISINRNAPNRKELIERLKQEAKAAGGLDHPNIITIYDVGQEDDLVYLSMQFLEGKTLLNVLAEDGLPSLPTLLSYADQICSAVGYAHARSVIHRDLKPANLMLTSQGVIKVLDFGIAKIEDATLTQTGLVVGTPTHMSPEQAGDKKIDHRSDIFALGSVFYELFTREKPFKGDVTTVLYKIIHEDPLPPSVINPGLPGGIDAIIRKALAKDPKDRFQNCEEMCKAFREQAALLKPLTSSSTPAITKVATPAPRPSAPSFSYLLESSERPPRRVWPWLITVLLLAISGTTAWAFYVKSSTGYFPPMVQKLAAALHRAPQRADNNSNAAGALPAQQPAGTNTPSTDLNTGGDSANAKPADSSANNAGTAGNTQAGQTSAANPGAPATASPQTSGATQPSGNLPSQNNSATDTTVSSPTTGGAGAQPIQANSGDSTTSSQLSAGTQSSASQSDSQSETPTDQSPDSAAKNPARPEPARIVDGFSRRDIPDLLRQADAAAGRGDYRLARYEYNLILKLDRNNAAARTGLRRVQSAEQNRAQR